LEDLAQAPVVRLEGGADLLDLAELDRVGHDHEDLLRVRVRLRVRVKLTLTLTTKT